MDTSAHADAPAVLHDALKQRYFLPHFDDKTASHTKGAGLYPPEVYHSFVDVLNLGKAILLDTSTTPANTEARVAEVRTATLTMSSTDPVIVASPTAADSNSSMIPPSEPRKTSSVLPSKAMVDRAADLTVDDAQGRAVPFRELYRAESGHKRRVMIIFIRHFFCGVSQPCSLLLHKLTTHATIRTVRSSSVLWSHKSHPARFLPIPR